MPRPSAQPVALAWLAFAVAIFGAALGPAAGHAALAAAAGSVFEAAPFVFFAERLPAGRARALAGLAGCGCGGRLPGALALAAIALCWLAFGPLVALARTVAALGLVAIARPEPESHAPRDDDPFATLATVGASAAATALALAATGDHLAAASATIVGRAAGVAAGGMLGVVSPCATAAVAIAAALAPHAPFAAAGVLATGGLLRLPRPRRRPTTASPTSAGTAREPTVAATFARIALAATLAWLAWRGPAGFLNPRLRPALAIGALVAIASARRPAGRTLAPIVSGLALAGLVAGSPVPIASTTATSVEDGYPGRRLAFVGRARTADRATTVERFTITCCRADAVAETVHLARRLPVTNGTWVVARGTLRAEPGGALVLDDVAWRTIPEPADPFSYR